MHDRFNDLEHLIFSAPFFVFVVWHASQDSLAAQVSCGQEAKEHPVCIRVLGLHVSWGADAEHDATHMRGVGRSRVASIVLVQILWWRSSPYKLWCCKPLPKCFGTLHCLCAYHRGMVSLSCGVSWCLSMFARVVKLQWKSWDFRHLTSLHFSPTCSGKMDCKDQRSFVSFFWCSCKAPPNKTYKT